MTRAVKIAPPPGGLRPTKPRRVNAPRCGECPLWDAGWCRLVARIVGAGAGMCAYGRRKRQSAAHKRHMEFRRARVDAGKHTKHTKNEEAQWLRG